MSAILDEVLDANAAYAANFGDKGTLALPPARHFVVLTCMDARLDLAKYAGLSEGDAHVIRNAGGGEPATVRSGRWSSPISCSEPANGS
jgi:carbonic anhydrase